MRVHVASNVAETMILKKVSPKPPSPSSTHYEGIARVQGTVILHVNIGETGDVQTADLVSRHPMLAPAAIKAVKQWKYKPYLLNGKPVEFDTNVRVDFRFSDSD